MIIFFLSFSDVVIMAGLGSKMKTWFILHLLLCYLIVASGLIVSCLMACTLVLWPFSKNLYRKVNSYLAYSWWCRKYNDLKKKKKKKAYSSPILAHPAFLLFFFSYSCSLPNNSELFLHSMLSMHVTMTTSYCRLWRFVNVENRNFFLLLC